MFNFIYRLVKGSPLTWSELDGNFKKIADQAMTKEELSSPDGSSLVGHQGGSVSDAIDQLISSGQRLEGRVDHAILSYSTYAKASLAATLLPDDQEVIARDMQNLYKVQDGILIFVEKVKRLTEIFVSDLGLSEDGDGNSAKIVSAVEKCISIGAELIFDGMFTLKDPLILTEAHSGLRTGVLGSNCGIRWADGLNFTAGPNIGLLTLDPTGEMNNVFIASMLYDGNKSNVTASSDNTVHCISILDSLGGKFNNVVIDKPLAINTRGSGISVRNGGVDIIQPISYGNTWHGIGVAFSIRSSGITRFFGGVEVFDNGAYGFNASSGKTIVQGAIITSRNGQGGGKTSADCLAFKTDSFISIDNKAFAFRTTGLAPNLVMEIGSIQATGTISDGGGTNLGQSISISTGNQITIGSIYTDGGSGESDVDIRIGGAENFDIGSIVSNSAKNRGIYLPAFNGSIGSISVNNSGKLGLLVDSSSRISIGGKISCLNANRLGNTGIDSHSVVVIGSDVDIAGSLDMRNGPSAPTTTRGLSASSGSRLNINGVFRSEGIADVDAIVTSGTGTIVKFSGVSVGPRLETKETVTLSGNGVNTAFTLNLANPLSSVGGGFYSAEVYGNTNDANLYGFSVYQVSNNLVRIRFTNPPPSGTNNLEFILRVKCNVYR